MAVVELKEKAMELSAEDLQEFLKSVLEEMPVIRMNELVKYLEVEWDVSAAAPVVVAGAAAAGEDGAAEVEEQTEFDVILNEVGESKLKVIKVVREATGLGIKEAKGIVDEAPRAIKEKVSKAEAEELVQKLTEAGGVAEAK